MSSLATFDPSTVKSLKTNLGDFLFDAIPFQQFKAGKRLNESDLARRLRISRTAIRKTLHQLEGQGIVTYSPRRGMFVQALTQQEVQEICDIRLMGEPKALDLCKANFDAQAERDLSQFEETLENYNPEEVAYFSRTDLKLHQTIWSYSRNKQLEKNLLRPTAPLFVFAASTGRGVTNVLKFRQLE